MKLDPAKVKFLPPLVPSLTARTIRFVGKRNSVQLLETALVVEGNILKVTLLSIERLFQAAVSEWTTVSVPYARIVKAKQQSRLFLRLFWLGLGLFFFTWSLDVSFKNRPEDVIYILGIGLFLLLFFGYLAFRLPSRYVVVFRSKDRRKRAFFFKIRSRKLRKSFDEALQRNRQVARESLERRMERSKPADSTVVAGAAGRGDEG